MTDKKLVTFTVNNNGKRRSTRINVASIKKAMNYDSQFDREASVYNNCIDRAIEKLYGNGKYFIQDNSGIDGRGQIWKHGFTGGSDSVTGIIQLDDDWDD